LFDLDLILGKQTVDVAALGRDGSDEDKEDDEHLF
jgi:hypothetical protein